MIAKALFRAAFRTSIRLPFADVCIRRLHKVLSPKKCMENFLKFESCKSCTCFPIDHISPHSVVDESHTHTYYTLQTSGLGNCVKRNELSDQLKCVRVRIRTNTHTISDRQIES